MKDYQAGDLIKVRGVNGRRLVALLLVGLAATLSVRGLSTGTSAVGETKGVCTCTIKQQPTGNSHGGGGGGGTIK